MRRAPALALIAPIACQTSERSAPPPARDDDRFSRRRDEMVRSQIEARGIADPALLAAMRAVPRHELVPEAVRESPHAPPPGSRSCPPPRSASSP